jgi:hypothetical protein
MARASQRDRLLDEGLMSYLKAVAALSPHFQFES